MVPEWLDAEEEEGRDLTLRELGYLIGLVSDMQVIPALACWPFLYNIGC